MRNRPLVQLVASAVGATFLLVARLAVARSVAGARGFLIGGGVVYLVLTAYGSVIDLDSNVNVVPVNGADNLLHLVLGVVMIALGWCSASSPPTRRPPTPAERPPLDAAGHRKEVRHVQGVRMRDDQQGRQVGRTTRPDV